MTIRQKILTILLALLAGLAISLLLGEVWLRLGAPPRLQNDRIILPRNQVYRYSNSGLRGCDPLIVHHKNSLGFRGAEPPKDFSNALTLIAVGGSTTECFYLSDGKSWPEWVGQQLHERYPRLWINNAGLDGHSTFGHLILLKDYIAQLRPNIVLFLVGINDVGREDLVVMDREFLRANRDTTPLKRLARTLEDHSRVIGWMENIARSIAAWKRGLGHHPVALEDIPALAVSETQTQEILRRHQTRYLIGYRGRLEALVTECRRLGIQPVFITQPALYGKGHDQQTGVDMETIRVDAEQNGRVAWKVLELYNDQTRDTARTHHLQLIDLAHDLPKSSRYFYDFYHFTNAGAEVAATIVSQALSVHLARAYRSFSK